MQLGNATRNLGGKFRNCVKWLNQIVFHIKFLNYKCNCRIADCTNIIIKNFKKKKSQIA